jgi:hypothetical protein
MYGESYWRFACGAPVPGITFIFRRARNAIDDVSQGRGTLIFSPDGA